MNVRDLKYLVAVADLGHFSQAAEQCFVSQPTLSGQIKKLEETLGVKLFERTNRRVMLTSVGEQMVESARRILCEVNTMHEIAGCAKDPLSGKLRLGAFPTLSPYIFPDLVSKVQETMPDLRLILIEEKTADLVEKLKRGDIDAALLALPVHDDSLVSRKLFDDEFFLAVPANHELAKCTTVDQGMLSRHRLLLLEEGHCLRDQALEVCQLHGIGEEQDFRATGIETLRQMVKGGTGITFMPRIAMRENEPGIRYIRFETPAPTRTIGLVWRKTSARQEAMESLIKLCARG